MSNELFRGFGSVQSRGLIAIPKPLRDRLHLDEPGAQVEFVEREDGVVELRGHLPVPADQAWFWTERWQAMEAKANADIAAGRLTTFASTDAFLDGI